MNISFNKNEYDLINKAIYSRIDDLRALKEEDKLKHLYNTLLLVNPKEVEEGKVLDITFEDILNMTESLFDYIEEYNRLIIRNRTEGYPTDIYEGIKEELVNLYKKIISIR